MDTENKTLVGAAVKQNTFRFNEEYKLFLPPVIISIILLLIGQILNPGFADANNVGNILAIASILAIAAAGQTLVIISGGEGIDLSIGQVMSLGALIGCGILNGLNANIPVAILVLIIMGAIIGLINSIGIWWVGIPPLVMTLAMGTVAGGFSLAITQGRPQGSVPSLLLTLGGGKVVGPVRWLFILTIIVLIIIELVLARTKYGKSLFLTGNNRNAARLCGIKVGTIIFITYILSGILGMISGLLLLSFIGTAQLQMGDNYTMLSVAAVVIGGTQLSGGKGTYIGTVLGAIVIVILTNVLISIGMGPGVRQVITGIVLLLILLAYSRQPSIRQ
ncbi:ABC transporter permease [Moorella sp. Hama-1]|uniref:ABC transporter permease n=1 Tax=Moorella sp. Hama-1 TaxID=2138101 RepID=UPI001379A4A1|nr:ABC transporter permease [Moorella sp. Hama-1]BCV21389.1 ribose ABC transporter permease [Moorella sp. Hama-1]